MKEVSNSMGFSEKFARVATKWTGSTWGFGAAVLTILVWGVLGPVFHFSDTWQLVINTGTGLITFLMVFLIQRSQNNDSHAVHLKLNEIVAAINGASNRLISAEDLSEEEVAILTKYYQELVKRAKDDGSLQDSHSVEEAAERHGAKKGDPSK